MIMMRVSKNKSIEILNLIKNESGILRVYRRDTRCDINGNPFTSELDDISRVTDERNGFFGTVKSLKKIF